MGRRRHGEILGRKVDLNTPGFLTAYFRYRADGKLWSVTVQTSSGFTPGNPTVVFEDKYGLGLTWSLREYDISPDGRRFFMIQPKRQAGLKEIVVVLNWFQELNRLVPTN